MPKPAKDLKFRSFEELDNFMKEYQKECKQTFVTRGSVVDGDKAGIKRVLKEGIKYQYINYVCKHGQLPRPTKQTTRNARSLKVGCEARVRAHASRNGDYLIISQVHLEHQGHYDNEVDPVPEVRRLNSEQLSRVQSAIKLKPSRPRLMEWIQEEFGVYTTPQDLKNIQRKMNPKPVDEFLEISIYLEKK
ncbi:hypothetical protein QAD02_017945, partial [Eretmocerus hayati]